jgi:hypothetical protein
MVVPMRVVLGYLQSWWWRDLVLCSLLFAAYCIQTQSSSWIAPACMVSSGRLSHCNMQVPTASKQEHWREGMQTHPPWHKRHANAVLLGFSSEGEWFCATHWTHLIYTYLYTSTWVLWGNRKAAERPKLTLTCSWIQERERYSSGEDISMIQLNGPSHLFLHQATNATRGMEGTVGEVKLTNRASIPTKQKWAREA